MNTDEQNNANDGQSRLTVGLGTVTPELRAIEHAEYMAKSAEHFIQAVDEFANLINEFGSLLEDDDEHEISDAAENAVEASRNLRSMIYEFRKRAAKVPND